MSSRDSILDSLTDLEGGLPTPFAAPAVSGDLVAVFTGSLTGLGAEMVSREQLTELAGKTVFADADVPVELLSGLVPTESVWDAEVGITFADFGVAETGSLVLSAGPGRHRLASLAPPLHVAVLSRKNILANLEEAIARLGVRTSVVITGPSRTADIEGVLVRGIHGPGRVLVLLTD